MARVCHITGKRMMVGNNVSHSNRKTKRTFQINLFKKKRFYLEEEKRWIKLDVSTHGLRIIDKKGLKNALKEATEKGFISKY